MTMQEGLWGVYGAPPQHLAPSPPGARQLSPLFPGGTDLGAAAPGLYARIAMQAQPGTLERRYALAQALRALAPGGELIAVAPKDKGGARLGKGLLDGPLHLPGLRLRGLRDRNSDESAGTEPESAARMNDGGRLVGRLDAGRRRAARAAREKGGDLVRAKREHRHALGF